MHEFVSSDCAAIKAGMREGDVLLSCNETALSSVDQLKQVISDAPAPTVTLRILRENRIDKLELPAGPLGTVLVASDITDKFQSALHTSVILSTTANVAGKEITETLDVITAECVFGMNIFKDFFASITDVFGGRSGSTQTVLRDARKTCLSELRREALDIGADAVVGVALDYSEISGGGKSMMFLVASGTAVRFRKEGG
ncbi:MAG: heavy metal-binding domain-containing protein [Marinobacterium sp.]|nr:heavy metal-binding domain-containing protein [Marinobacterium sp.]